MHIALGVRTNAFPIDKFLNAVGRTTVTINATAQPGKAERAALKFSSNPDRRAGEWLIHDQFSHRHPAWSGAAGFPARYRHIDPPYLLIFRVGNTFHARYANSSRLVRLGGKVIPSDILAESKGVLPASETLLSAFDVPQQPLLETFLERAADEYSEPFDPANIVDGRERILTAVFQRLGQQIFRSKLLSAYRGQCAVTRCRTKWVLEAAHITPYRGIKTNAITNGLLLRADVHTLFDLALIAIEPTRLKIRVSKVLHRSEYARLDGGTPVLPDNIAARPSRAALEEHFSLFHR